MLLYTLSAIVCFSRKIGNPASETLPFRVCLIVSIGSYCTNYVYFRFILEAIKHFTLKRIKKRSRREKNLERGRKDVKVIRVKQRLTETVCAVFFRHGVDAIRIRGHPFM